MYTSSQLKDLSDTQLQKCRANAYVTGCRAIGHFKGEQNERLESSYKKEITTLGLDVDLSIEGVFNGEGSW